VDLQVPSEQWEEGLCWGAQSLEEGRLYHVLFETLPSIVS